MAESERFYTCPVHTRKLSATKGEFCPDCVDDYRSRKDVKLMAPLERLAAFDALPALLTMPFEYVHNRINELVGRRVFTHEMVSHNLENIRTEILGGQHPSLAQQISHVPKGTKVIPVEMPGEDDTQSD